MLFSFAPATGVLLVCRENICRSPMAEALLREEFKLRGVARRVRLDSAGTQTATPGHPADGRALQVCAREGIDLRRSRARRVTAEDFSRFDHLLAMDHSVRQALLERCPQPYRERISLFGDWAPDGGIGDIPDPYFGSVTAFEQVLAMLHRAADGFVPHLLATLGRDAQAGAGRPPG